MKSSLFKETAAHRQIKLPLLPPVIVGADRVEQRGEKVFAWFDGDNPEQSCNAFFEDHHSFAADIHLVFNRGAKRLFFLRAERLMQADLAFEVTIEEDAEVAFVFLMKDLPDASVTLNIKTELKGNARFSLAGVHIGEGEFFADISAEMNAENALSSLSVIDVQKGNGKSDLRIENICDAPHTSGKILVRNILFGNSASRFQGIPVITHKGRNSANHLDQSALLLSPNAKMNAFPLLSVSNNSVQATHKSSTARLLPEDRFYLSTRGINPRDAEKLLLNGFLTEVLSDIKTESIRNCTSESVHHFLEDEQ